MSTRWAVVRKCDFVVLSFTFLLVGCSLGVNSQSQLIEATYNGEVKKIMNEHCIGCHKQGGSAPFSLETYKDVASRAGWIASVTKNRTMPPWGAVSDGSCGEFKDSNWLSDEEIAILDAFKENGSQPGVPNFNVPNAINYTSEIVDPSLELTQAETYTPTFPDNDSDGIPDDEYRCYVYSNAAYDFTAVESIQFVPSPEAVKVAHHALGFNVSDAASLILLQQLDDASPGAGFPCESMAQVNIAVNAMVLAWSPGKQPLNFAPGTAIGVVPKFGFVVQEHLSAAALGSGADIPAESPKIQLKFAQNATTAVFAAALSGAGFTIPAKSEHSLAVELPIGADITLFSVTPHMHLLGKKALIEVIPQDATQANQCITKVDHYNFEWQYTYEFEEPLFVSAGSKLRMTCTWDNTKDVAVEFGDESDEEMCFGMFYFILGRYTPPPFSF